MEREERMDYRRHKEMFGSGDVILIVVMVSWMYTDVNTNQTEYLKYVQFIVLQ